MPFNHRQLEAFGAVMRTGGISSAARAVHLSQPAVSKLIAALEDELGFALFRRQSKRLVPTEEAHIFLGEVEAACASWERLTRVAADLGKASLGTLSIGTVATTGLTIMPGIVSDFQRDNPKASVFLQIHTTAKLLELAHAQQVDLCISMLPSTSPSVASETLLSCRAVCVLPPGHPLSEKSVLVPSDFQELPFVSLGEEDRTRQVVDRFFEETEVRRRIFTITQFAMAACEFVRCSGAVTILDPITAASHANRDLVIRPIDTPIIFDIRLLQPLMRPPSAIRDRFVARADMEAAGYGAYLDQVEDAR